MELRVPFEVWDRMKELDRRVRLHYIQPEYCILQCVASFPLCDVLTKGLRRHPAEIRAIRDHT